jgi:hypothetical protein
VTLADHRSRPVSDAGRTVRGVPPANKQAAHMKDECVQYGVLRIKIKDGVGLSPEASDSAGAVEGFADDVGVAGVAGGLRDHVEHDVAQVALEEVRARP